MPYNLQFQVFAARSSFVHESLISFSTLILNEEYIVPVVFQ